MDRQARPSTLAFFPAPPPNPRSLHTSHSPSSSLTMQSCCTLRGTYAGTLRSCCMLRYAFAGSLPLTPPLPSSPHTLMLTHLAGITDIGTCQNALRIAASDEGAAAAAVAAALPTTRAGPPGWRRRRVPRTGPGASAPGGRAGSGGYDEGATATAVAGPPGWRRRRVPRTGPGASSLGGRAGSGAAAAAVVAAALPTALAGPPGRPCREPRTDPGASARAPA